MSSQTQQRSGMGQAGPRPPPSTKNPITGEELPKGYTAVFECNMMTYKDGDGKEHSIYMPPGTMSTACKHYSESNWDELAKFPPWENQPRTEADVILQKIDDEDEDEADDAACDPSGDK